MLYNILKVLHKETKLGQTGKYASILFKFLQDKLYIVKPDYVYQM